MIVRKKLADSVIEEIKGMILNGQLKEGDKLPNQNEFAAQMGVSRSSLREALHTLALMGAIEQRPGFGTVIRAEAPVLFAHKMVPPMMSDAIATEELIDCRRFIETGTVELAVRNATDEEIEEIGVLVKKMKKATSEKKAEDYQELDVEFHYRIATASHNRYLIHMIATLRSSMEQFRREILNVLPGFRSRSLNFHESIYQALKERNEKKAISQMNKHIMDVMSGLKSYYKLTGKES